jgi:hypothetical protein
VSPLSPGRAERHGFAYYRHGTLCRCWPLDAVDTKSGTVLSQRRRAIPAPALVEFLSDIVATQPPGREIHRDRGQPVDAQDPSGAHVSAGTPACASEFHAFLLVLAQSSRALIRDDETRCARARGIFTSVADLAQDSAVYPTLHKTAKPVRWSIAIPRVELVVLQRLQSTRSTYSTAGELDDHRGRGRPSGA